MAERIEMREFPSKPPPFWKKTKKQYFQKDPPKFCYIENDKKISGTPLWPKDPLFHPENLEIYLQIAKEEARLWRISVRQSFLHRLIFLSQAECLCVSW